MDSDTGTRLYEGTISEASELAALIPDSQDLRVGIKGHPLKINGEWHCHPDDEQEEGTKEPEPQESQNEEAGEDDILSNL